MDYIKEITKILNNVIDQKIIETISTEFIDTVDTIVNKYNDIFSDLSTVITTKDTSTINNNNNNMNNVNESLQQHQHPKIKDIKYTPAPIKQQQNSTLNFDHLRYTFNRLEKLWTVDNNKISTACALSNLIIAIKNFSEHELNITLSDLITYAKTTENNNNKDNK